MSRKTAEIVPKKAGKPSGTIRLGAFAFRLADHQLTNGDGTPVALRKQSAEVLAVLAARPGEVVGKSELIDAVWADTHVTDDSLVQCITDIRKAIGDAGHRIVQTYPRRGYRLDPAASAGRPGPAQRIAAVISAAALAAVLVALFLWPGDRGDAAVPSIAVLAFDDLSAGEEKGFLSDAISEGIITELSRFPEFRVIARNSSFRYRGTATDVRRIGAELGAVYVLEGSQQKAGDRLRVTFQLVNAGDGTHIMAETLDRNLADLFIVQDEIVRRVAATVGRKISHEPPPSSIERVSALLYSMQSRKHQHRFTREDNAEALRLGQLAVEADPASPYGYIGLVYAYSEGFRRGWIDLDPEEVKRRARRAAETALELDPENYAAHMAMAWVHYHSGEPEAAVARYRRAIELNPSASSAMAAMSIPLMSLGRLEEAAATIERANAIDPHHPDWFDWNLSWVQYILGDCEKALQTYLRMTSPSNLTRRTLAGIYVCLGRQQEAEATVAAFLEAEPGYRIADIRDYMEREFRDAEALEHWLADLRTAGLPE